MLRYQPVVISGHFLLTNMLLGKLKASAPSRIVNVASTAHEKAPLDFDDLTTQFAENFDPYKTFGRSKTANILFTVHLASILEGKLSNDELFWIYIYCVLKM